MLRVETRHALSLQNHPVSTKPPCLYKITLSLQNHLIPIKPPYPYKITLSLQNHLIPIKPPYPYKITLSLQKCLFLSYYPLNDLSYKILHKIEVTDAWLCPMPISTFIQLRNNHLSYVCRDKKSHQSQNPKFWSKI